MPEAVRLLDPAQRPPAFDFTVRPEDIATR